METTQPVSVGLSRQRLVDLLNGASTRGVLGFLLALALALITFAVLLLVIGKDPLVTYGAIFAGSIGDGYGLSEIVVKMTPFILCALATAIPAKAGLVNVGGEGQLYMGAWAATFVALNFGFLPGFILIPLLMLAGCFGGGLWAGLVGWMRVRFNLNETIASLLLNYVASLIVDFFVHGPWKDTSGMNWPYTAEFSESARLMSFGTTRISLGIFFALAAVALYRWLMFNTRWGYNIQVVGGNPEAGRRSGLAINRYTIAAMALGGAMAGLYGMIEVTAIQGRLRGGISGGYGYIGFLVAWLAGHAPFRIVVMAALLGLISVGGDMVQIRAGLPASAVNILMALILFFVLARFEQRSPAAS